ncbi:uncharacterized protein TRIADDRAFT_4315, partial [Trichoplax adhaerens]
IHRYLQANHWNIDEAEEMILRTLKWRIKHQPQLWQCKWCIETPGYHAWRQVGFDKTGRPVIYSCFAQEQAKSDTIEDTIVHMVYLIENAIATMPDDNCTWIWILDCTGITMSSTCNKLNAKVMNLLSNHYPCRLGQLLCINYNWIFSSIWSTAKLFLTPQTIAKVRLVTPAQLKPLFTDLFPINLCNWLLDEIELNKSEQLSQSQANFWVQPFRESEHDPRGCGDYITRYL